MSRRKFHSAPHIVPFSGGHVDKVNRKIFGATAMATGEAIGHNLWADGKTLAMMAELANARKYPVMMRFGHPGMSENAFGKKLAKANNFRVQGDKLVHDIEFMDWADDSPVFTKDPVPYILNRADRDPTSFGESVVVETDAVWVLTDGTEVSSYEERPDNALYKYPVMRPVQFHWVDFVGDGALTPDGMFSADALIWKDILEGTSSEYTMEFFRMLKNFQERFNLSPQELHIKANQFLSKFVAWETFNMQTGETKTRPVQADAGVGSPGTAPEHATEPEHDPIAEALAESEAIVAETGGEPADGVTDVAEVDPSAYVPREQFEQLQSQITQLTTTIANLSLVVDRQATQLEAIGKWMKHNNVAMKNLTARVDAVNEEDIVTTSVTARAFSNPGAFQMPVPAGTFEQPVEVGTKFNQEMDKAGKVTLVASDDPFEDAWNTQPGLNGS